MNWNLLKERAYVPYSGKTEVCVIIDDLDFAHPGVRIENGAFPDTISCFQAAIYGCLSVGRQAIEILIPETYLESHPQLIYLKNEYSLKVNFCTELPTLNWFSAFNDLKEITLDDLKTLLPFPKITESDFPVVSFIKTDLGFISGVNIENTDWRMGLCAERVAISRAISNGASNLGEMYIFAPKASYGTPCGACRQVINEHLPNERLYMYHGDETHSEIIAQYLLPHSFMSASLKKF
jgi:cytidine deaminase